MECLLPYLCIYGDCIPIIMVRLEIMLDIYNEVSD